MNYNNKIIHNNYFGSSPVGATIIFTNFERKR